MHSRTRRLQMECWMWVSVILEYPACCFLCLIIRKQTTAKIPKATKTPPTIKPVASPDNPHLPPFFKLPPLRLHFLNVEEQIQWRGEVFTMGPLESNSFISLNEVLPRNINQCVFNGSKVTYYLWGTRQNQPWSIRADSQSWHTHQG